MLVAAHASTVTVSAVEGSSVHPLPCHLRHSLHWDVYAFLHTFLAHVCGKRSFVSSVTCLCWRYSQGGLLLGIVGGAIHDIIFGIFLFLCKHQGHALPLSSCAASVARQFVLLKRWLQRYSLFDDFSSLEDLLIVRLEHI